MVVSEPRILYAPSSDDDLQLVEIDVGNYAEVLRLKLAEGQERFVADNAKSIVQGHYHEGAWFRAVYLDGEAVGFVMLHDLSNDDPVGADPGAADRQNGLFIWRLMIGRQHQGKGIGYRLMDILIRIARAGGFERLSLTFVDAEGGPEGFYRRCGFVTTGRIIDGELEAVLELG